MSPLVLALIDAVLGLAFHHDERARGRVWPDHEAIHVRAEIAGPRLTEPVPGGLELRVVVTYEPRSEEQAVEEQAVRFYVDVSGGRLLALELELAELPLTRSGFARLLGELESWCYRRIPL